MPFSFQNTLAGLAGGWDDPSIAARHLFKKKEDKYRQELEDESFKKRLTTAYNQERVEEGDTLDDIARAAVIGGEVDPVTNAPITQGAAYRKAIQTLGEAKAAQPLESAYKSRMTTAMMPEAASTGKAESKAGIVERMKRASTALLGSEEAESERPLVGKRASMLDKGYERGTTAHALATEQDKQKLFKGVPEAEALRDARRFENEAEQELQRKVGDIPRLTSAAESENLKLAYDTANKNRTLGVPGAESKARVSQAEFAEQEARQRRITGRLEPSEMEKQRAANAEYDRIKTESGTQLLKKPALAEKFATASQMDPNKIPEFLSDEELGYYRFLRNIGALDVFIQVNSGIYRPGIFNPLTTATWGGSRTPTIDPELMSEFGLKY